MSVSKNPFHGNTLLRRPIKNFTYASHQKPFRYNCVRCATASTLRTFYNQIPKYLVNSYPFCRKHPIQTPYISIQNIYYVTFKLQCLKCMFIKFRDFTYFQNLYYHILKDQVLCCCVCLK